MEPGGPELRLMCGVMSLLCLARVRVGGGGGGACELLLARVKGDTPARRAISFSPICQCMASAARQGMAISSAMRDHMSALNLSQHVSPRGIEVRQILVQRSTQDIPLVQPSELILTVFVPLAPAFKVVLIVQSTTNGASTRKVFTDIFPFHALSAQVNDLSIFVW